MKKNEMGGSHSTYEDRIGAYKVLVADVKERGHLRDLGVDGRAILKWFFRK
jgi:hypothetical protein